MTEQTEKQANTVDEAKSSFLKNKSVRWLAAAVAILGALLIVSLGTEAVTAGGATLHSEFDGMWDEVQGLMTGSPAKILMGFSIIGVLMFAVVKPNLIGFAASVVTLLVLANAAGTIDSSLTVHVNALQALLTESKL